MAGIRVNSGDKIIEVNDAGETITLRFSDQSFPNQAFAMIERVQAKAEEALKEEESMRGRHAEDKDAFDFRKEAADMNEKLHRYIASEIDGVFGPETCRKVFGDIVPDITLVMDFFEQLTPYFESYGKERAAKMQKYSAARTGNV